MVRAEIIANQSVEEDLTELLEQTIPGILYTEIPLVTGRGSTDRKLGTVTWPETNFTLFSYIDDDQVPVMKAVIRALKKKFTSEGIKLFLVKAEDND